MRLFLPNRFAADNARVNVAWHMAADGLHREYLAKADALICQKFFAIGTVADAFRELQLRTEKQLEIASANDRPSVQKFLSRVRRQEQAARKLS